MKKFVSLSLFVFWAITVAVIVAGLLSYNQKQPSFGTDVPTTSQITGTATGSKSVGTNNNALSLTTVELKKHNSTQSCWLLISGKIYDVTSFLRQHPGGANTILPTCGTDATAAYDTRGGTGSHSSTAYSMLNDYYIGNLNQTINAGIVNVPAPASTTIPPKSFSNAENEGIDD